MQEHCNLYTEQNGYLHGSSLAKDIQTEKTTDRLININKTNLQS